MQSPLVHSAVIDLARMSVKYGAAQYCTAFYCTVLYCTVCAALCGVAEVLCGTMRCGEVTSGPSAPRCNSQRAPLHRKTLFSLSPQAGPRPRGSGREACLMAMLHVTVLHYCNEHSVLYINLCDGDVTCCCAVLHHLLYSTV
jgi:hypothetical protein